MIADIAIRAVTLNATVLGPKAVIGSPGIVLIDELDQHLHPRWQRRITHDLRTTFPNLQFICTTHSPQIVGEVPRESVHLLTPDGAQVPPVAYGADTNWILEHVMGATERNDETNLLIRSIEDALEEGKLGEAQNGLKKLRAKVGNEERAVARLESSIRNLLELAHAEN
jgi:predicted ATP-binding protein involved in virulence